MEIIESIDAESSTTVIAEKYGTCIAESTVANIKKESMEMGFQKAASKTI